MAGRWEIIKLKGVIGKINETHSINPTTHFISHTLIPMVSAGCLLQYERRQGFNGSFPACHV